KGKCGSGSDRLPGIRMQVLGLVSGRTERYISVEDVQCAWLKQYQTNRHRRQRTQQALRGLNTSQAFLSCREELYGNRKTRNRSDRPRGDGPRDRIESLGGVPRCEGMEPFTGTGV